MSSIKQKLLLVLRYSVYPLFYILCLLTFFYLTFPWDRVRDRIVAEFDATQAGKGAEAQRLEIGSVTGHWFTGIAIDNARLTVPPSASEVAAAELAARRAATAELEGEPLEDGEGEDAAADDATDPADGSKPKKTDAKAGPKKKVATGPKDTVLLVERATARVKILPLLLGRVQVAFHVEAFGGEISGSVPAKGTGDIDVALDNVDLGQIGIIRHYLTVPLRGIASGELALVRGEGGKLSKSTGSLDLTIEDAILGDGKSKIANLITLPAAKLGKLEVAGAAEAGVLKIAKFGASGGDLEISAEGQAKLKDKWKSSALDLFLRFKFSDEYRTKDDKTKVLFGEPGSKIPGMIDTQPKIKRAKRGDDSYGLHVYGSLKSPKYEPWTSDDATPGAPKKKAGATAADDDDDDDDAAAAGAAADSPFKRSKARDRTTPTPTPPRTTPPRPTPPRSEPEPVERSRNERRDEPRNDVRSLPEGVQLPEGIQLEEPIPEPVQEAPQDQGPVDEAPPGDPMPEPPRDPATEDVPAP